MTVATEPTLATGGRDRGPVGPVPAPAGPAPRGGPGRPRGTTPLHATDPARVNGYRLVARLGTGGMADVYYAVAPARRTVVVKVLRDSGDSPGACYREYRLARVADVDCTPPTLGYGASDAGPYLVMAYLPGYRCGTTLTESSISDLWLWRFGASLAGVISTLHARGIVHCDVKPANLLIRDHHLRVIDFGIARYVGERPTGDGTVRCSPGWAAPEQLRAALPTPAVDVFAWGCVLAYLASGVHPFAGHDHQEWLRRVQSAEPELSHLPPKLDRLVRWTLARDPRDRPSAAELADTCRTMGPPGYPRPSRRIR